MKHTLIALLLTLAATGCCNLSKLAKELKDDPASVGLSVNTLYGSGRLFRTGLHSTNATTTINADGIVIKTN